MLDVFEVNCLEEICAGKRSEVREPSLMEQRLDEFSVFEV
jgi:hypothetical protein